jgi:hypothetical protein
MRRATEEASDHHELWAIRRYSILIRPGSGIPRRVLAATARRVGEPTIATCSLVGPSWKQILTFEAVRATRLTGTVTAPLVQPLPATPLVSTLAPDSALTLTCGPVSDDSVRRIAEVPAGSTSPAWQAPAAL